MKNWHWILVIVLVYFVGVKFSGPGKAVLSKIGM
jgi:hypothetical protein